MPAHSPARLRPRLRRAVTGAAAVTALALVPLAAGGPPAGAAARGPVPAPAHQGTLRITGAPRDGRVVTAAGLSWSPGRLPAGETLLSFAVAYAWQSCQRRDRSCRTAADASATPYAARQYRVGHADTGRWLRVTETASEVIETAAATFSFQDVRRSVSGLAAVRVAAYPRHQRPASAFVNGLPEQRTGSDAEYFQVSAAHFNQADGPAVQRYRVDGGPWHKLPADHAFYAGHLRPGRHQVAVSTADRAGSTRIQFSWHVVPLPAPAPCRPAAGRPCWYPPHLAASGRPLRWDWQIGRAQPLERTGRRAVDMYDLDGFLTTAAQVRAITTTWPAATLPHPRTVCYLDLAWEDYRPDAAPGRYFPARTLGNIYYGYPQERWVDLRQLDVLEPVLRERISMCARKGFDAVELDDIDSFDPPAQTGFRLTPGDLQNFLAYAFNEIHSYGMTGLWKNSPYLSWWGRRYADGALLEECYLDHGCTAAQLRGSTQYGITCTGLHGATPCGFDDFSTDVTPQQPNGKWVGDAEYTDDNYVCRPGQQKCGPHQRSFRAFCRAVYDPPAGFAAVLFDVNLDGKLFAPCPQGT